MTGESKTFGSLTRDPAQTTPCHTSGDRCSTRSSTLNRRVRRATEVSGVNRGTTWDPSPRVRVGQETGEHDGNSVRPTCGPGSGPPLQGCPVGGSGVQSSSLVTVQDRGLRWRHGIHGTGFRPARTGRQEGVLSKVPWALRRLSDGRVFTWVRGPSGVREQIVDGIRPGSLGRDPYTPPEQVRTGSWLSGTTPPRLCRPGCGGGGFTGRSGEDNWVRC